MDALSNYDVRLLVRLLHNKAKATKRTKDVTKYNKARAKLKARLNQSKCIIPAGQGEQRE